MSGAGEKITTNINWVTDKLGTLLGYKRGHQDVEYLAKLSTDASGNTVLVGAGGVIVPTMGAKIITVGAGGQFETLAEAIAYRNTTYPHTLLLTSTLTVSGTSSGTVPVHNFTLAAAIPNFSTRNSMLGIRVGGAAAPVIPCRMLSSTVGCLEYPFPADYAGAACEIVQPVTASIVLLPGTSLELTTSHTLPAYTTFGALIPGTATIAKAGGSGDMVTDTTANKIRFTGLTLLDRFNNINSILLAINQGYSANAFVPLADFQIDNCNLITGANDLVYCTAPGGIGFTAFNNKCFGTYDVFKLGTHRRAHIYNNEITVEALRAGDGEAATACVFGATGASAWDYPIQEHYFINNIVRCFTLASTFVDGWATATGVSIRAGVNTLNQFVISDNVFDLETKTTTAFSGTPYYGFSSSALVVGDVGLSIGAEAPTIVFKDNAVRSRATGTLPTAVLAYSFYAAAPVLSSGNRVFGGGSVVATTNVTAATTY